MGWPKVQDGLGERDQERFFRQGKVWFTVYKAAWRGTAKGCFGDALIWRDDLTVPMNHRPFGDALPSTRSDISI